jgi:hypothetical protein
MRGFFLFFGVSVVTAAIWGWWVVQGVRATAARTDTQMRTLAWATMAYADANEGFFPTSAESLKSVGVGPESITLAPPGGDAGWPVSRAEALRGAAPADLDSSLKVILVAWGPDSSVPPYFKPDGLPTLVGTNTEVNGWLDAMRKRSPQDETPAPK